MRTNLNRINKEIFNDYTEYEQGKFNNGGCYGYWITYTRIENGKFEVTYGSTADMEYCHCCGSFNNHYEGDDCFYESGYSCGDFTIVSEEELLNRINNTLNLSKKWRWLLWHGIMEHTLVDMREE